MFPDIPDFKTYASLFDDERNWRPGVEAILASRGIEREGMERAAGGSNIIYFLPDGRVFKAYAPIWEDEAIVELAMMRAINEDNTCSIQAPTIELEGVFERWRWCVMTRAPGQELERVWPELGREARVEITRALGDWITELRTHDAVQRAQLPAERADWSMTQSSLRADISERHARRGTPEHWVARIEAFMSSWGAIDEATTIHADLTNENILARQCERGWEISAVIDYADALQAPTLYEIAAPLVFLCAGEPILVAALLEASGLDPNTPAKTLLQWVLLHRFSNLGYYIGLECVPSDCETLKDLAIALFGERGG